MRLSNEKEKQIVLALWPLIEQVAGKNRPITIEIEPPSPLCILGDALVYVLNREPPLAEQERKDVTDILVQCLNLVERRDEART